MDDLKGEWPVGSNPLSALRRTVRIAGDAFRHFTDDDWLGVASHIALSTLMALFPFLIVVTALAGFSRFEGTRGRSRAPLLEAWPREVAAPIALDITGVLTSTRGDVLTLGVLFALYFASSGVESLRIGAQPRLRREGATRVVAAAHRIHHLRSDWRSRDPAFSFVVLAPLILAKLDSVCAGARAFADRITFARYSSAAAVLVVALMIVLCGCRGGLALAG
jgi:membrane protein